MNTYTLKRFQHYPRMSEETIAFNTDIAHEGVVIGSAENSGHGGCTFVYLNDKGRAIPAIVEASKLSEGNEKSLVDIVDNLVIQTLQAKWVARQRKRVQKQLATTVLFNRKGDKDGSFRTYKLAGKSAAEVIAFAKLVAEKPDVTRVLNLLPFEEAFHILVKVD